jgi:hypothetical protein
VLCTELQPVSMQIALIGGETASLLFASTI